MQQNSRATAFAWLDFRAEIVSKPQAIGSDQANFFRQTSFVHAFVPSRCKLMRPVINHRLEYWECKALVQKPLPHPIPVPERFLLPAGNDSTWQRRRHPKKAARKVRQRTPSIYWQLPPWSHCRRLFAVSERMIFLDESPSLTACDFRRSTQRQSVPLMATTMVGERSMTSYRLAPFSMTGDRESPSFEGGINLSPKTEIRWNGGRSRMLRAHA